jgi:hypothetical protein
VYLGWVLNHTDGVGGTIKRRSDGLEFSYSADQWGGPARLWVYFDTRPIPAPGGGIVTRAVSIRPAADPSG